MTESSIEVLSFSLSRLLMRYWPYCVLFLCVHRPLLHRLLCWGVTVYQRLIYLETPLFSVLVAYDQPIETRNSRFTGVRLLLCGRPLEWSVEVLEPSQGC